MSVIQSHAIVPCAADLANEETMTALIAQLGPWLRDRCPDLVEGDRDVTVADLAQLCEEQQLPLTITVGGVTVIPTGEDDTPFDGHLVDVLPHEAWYARQRYTMQPPVIDRHHMPGSTAEVTHRSAWPLRAAAGVYGRSLQREARYDTPLVDADEFPRSQRVLLNDSGVLASAALVSAALGFSKLNEEEHASFREGLNEPELSDWLLTWAYTHPYLRGGGEARSLPSEARERYGRFAIHGPFTPAGARFARHAVGDDLHLLTGPGSDQVRNDAAKGHG